VTRRSAIDVRVVTRDLVGDAETLFGTSDGSRHCFCMWFIIPVAQYHQNGFDGNKQLFCELIESSPAPVGLLAYDGDEAIGWCATGPRARYIRALKTPAYRGNDASENDSVWLVPCLYIQKHMRRTGVSRALVEAAVGVASDHEACAIEAFPFATGAKPGHNSMVGFEELFASCGFTVTRRPTPTRVVMRRALARRRDS
jgi:GNAT superfamily N-acetyltransferase